MAENNSLLEKVLSLQEKYKKLEASLADPDDSKNAMVEIRGGISIYPYANYGRPGTCWEDLARERFARHE